MTLQTRAPENFRLCRWGDERTVNRAQTVSEDPHRRERKLQFIFEKLTLVWAVAIPVLICSMPALNNTDNTYYQFGWLVLVGCLAKNIIT